LIHIIDFGSRKVPQIAAMIESLGHTTLIHAWASIDHNSLKDANGIVLSGSPAFLTEIDQTPYFEQCGFLKETSLSVLGICFGHQVLGILHGATIYRGPEVRSLNTIKILKADPIFEGLGRETQMTEDHTEGITLPDGFIHLASSDSYSNEGMKHKSKPIWGIQFHPEVSAENGLNVFRNFCKLL
jgi:GMP synthase (glutamine-hydrolysing)